MIVKAYLQVTMQVPAANRAAAAAVYTKYREPFLQTVPGALSKQLLIRDQDVQVLHGFDSVQHATDYLNNDLFTQHVAPELAKTWTADPDVRVYHVQ